MKVLYVVNKISFLFSHRKNIIEDVIQNGGTVFIISYFDLNSKHDRHAYTHFINLGAVIYRLRDIPTSINFLSMLLDMYQIRLIIKKYKIDILHCISPKGIFLGGLSKSFYPQIKCVFSFSGMGRLYVNHNVSLIGKWLRWIYTLLLRRILINKNTVCIVQNYDDKSFLEKYCAVRTDNIEIINGSGVYIDKYYYEKNIKEKIVLFPARLIKEKGVCDFIHAAKIVKAQCPDWDFAIAGTSGSEEPNEIDELVEGAVHEGTIINLGYVEDIHTLYNKTAIVCLPSYYGEGLPKSLLEAAASGCAVVTTDSVGCREAIAKDVSGLLVQPKDVTHLVEALFTLMRDNAVREGMQEAGRKMAITKYDIADVTKKHSVIYDTLNSPVNKTVDFSG